MKNRILSISLAAVLALSVGLISCGGEAVPEYSLAISSTEGGEVTTPGEGTFSYDEVTVVNLVAEPDEGYQFVNWTGDVTTIGNVNAAMTIITTNGDYEITANFEETPSITFAITGPMTDIRGQNQWNAATMAAEEVNDAGGVDINGTKYTVKLVKVETKELTAGEDGTTGIANLEAVIDDVDFVLGGYSTGIVVTYREVAMDAQKIFMNCGSSYGFQQYSVVSEYDRYKYWFKVSPYNEAFIVNASFKMTRAIGNVLKEMLEGYGDAVAENYRVPENGNLRVAILMEDAAWANPFVNAAQIWLPMSGFTIVGTWRPSATATDISAELLQIAAARPHIIFTAFQGSVAAVYSRQRVEVGMPAITIGLNVPGEQKGHWANTEGKCNGEIMLVTWAEGLQNTAKTTAFFNAFVTKTGEYPIFTAATYDAIYSLKEAIEAVSATRGWDDITDVVDPANIDALIRYLETSSYTGTSGTIAYYPMPAIDLGGGVYALSEAQVLALYPNLATYNQTNWLCAASGGPHIAHDLVYGPGYETGIGSQWQDGHKVCVWPMDLGDAFDSALTDQYGNWNFEYPGTVDVMIPIEGFLAS